jgi:hypothetical protein
VRDFNALAMREAGSDSRLGMLNGISGPRCTAAPVKAQLSLFEGFEERRHAPRLCQ